MPHIAISMYPGRAEQVKRNLAQKIQDLVVTELKVDRAVVSVSVKSVAKSIIKIPRRSGGFDIRASWPIF